MPNRRPIISCLLVLLVAQTGCKAKERERYTPGTATVVRGVNMADVKVALAARIDSSKPPSWVTADRWKRVKKLYESFGTVPLWLEADGVKQRGDDLLKAIEEAPTHALTTEGYPLDSIKAVVQSDNVMKTATAQALADADVLLTAAYVAYASDMLMGQVDPKTVSQSWNIPARVSEVDSSLVRSLQSPSMAEGLAAMAPGDSSYGVLKDAYARYQTLAKSGGWTPIPAGATVKPGGRIAPTRLSLLRQRLAVEGVLSDTAQPAATTDAKYTGTLVEAVELFQDRHGLARTGILGKATLEALNVPAAERVQQIASNLERHRWLPRSLGSKYIYVNVPAFRVEAYDSGQKVLEMKVVVGAEYQGRATPVFSDSMEFVVFRPYWNVTDAIAANEIFPAINGDPGYLDRGNYEIYSDHGKRRVRQKPGGANALGMVKFMFPNDFNIYLHDTPAKALFEQADRAASHGCIRLEKPDKMAEWVLGWDIAKVHSAMESGADNRTVNLPKKIPVYIVYFTTYARDGQLYFADDLYGRDDVLEEQVGDSAQVKPPLPPGRKGS